MQSLKKKAWMKWPLFFMSARVHACVHVYLCACIRGVKPFILVFQCWVRECLCVSAFSAGTISVEGKEHRETLKELLCTFEWNDPKKGFL